MYLRTCSDTKVEIRIAIMMIMTPDMKVVWTLLAMWALSRCTLLLIVGLVRDAVTVANVSAVVVETVAVLAMQSSSSLL